MKVTGNTILITGGGSGIGRGLAEAFHKAGNQVIIGGRRVDVLQRAATEYPGMAYVKLDTTDGQSIEAAVEQVTSNFPALNVIINNAGVQRVLDFAGGTVDEDAMAEEIETNIYGPLRMINAVLPHLKKQPSSTIINVSSGLAFTPLAKYPVYSATKAFVHSFSVSLRHQLRNSTVSVIELAPPWVKTDLDVTHEEPTVHQGRTPMPLSDFIAAAMEDLATDAVELPVATAKFVHASVSDRAAAQFDQINQ